MSVSLPAPVRAFFDATDAADTEAFLTAFAADVVVEDDAYVVAGPSRFMFRVAGEHLTRVTISA